MFDKVDWQGSAAAVKLREFRGFEAPERITKELCAAADELEEEDELEDDEEEDAEDDEDLDDFEDEDLDDFEDYDEDEEEEEEEEESADE